MRLHLYQQWRIYDINKEGRGAVGFDVVGCGERVGPVSRKKSFLSPQKMISLGAFRRSFNRQSQEALHGTQILRFNRKTKLT